MNIQGKISIAILGMVATSWLYAQEESGQGNLPHGLKIFGNSYGVSLGVGLNVATMQMQEKVFAEAGSDDTASDITYNINAQFGAEFTIHAKPYDQFNKIGVSLNGTYRTYVPVNAGTVIDQDWDYTGGEGEKFSHSEHEGSTLSYQEGIGRLLLTVPVKQRVVLGLGMDIWWSRLVYAVRDGWIQQVSEGEAWHDHLERLPLYGMASMYIQEWITIMPVVSVGTRFARHEISLYGNFIGWVFGDNLDYHYFRKIDATNAEERYVLYEDKIRGCNVIHIEGSWKLRINKRLIPEIAIGWRGVMESRGDSYMTTNGLVDNTYHNPDSASGRFSSLLVRAGVQVWL